jgi:CRISPR-associated endoribonuclease Cas6
MRVKVTLKRSSTPCNIPINYPSYISANLYRLLGLADAQYAAFLHDKGYEVKGKRFKYFTFGKLNVPKSKMEIDGSRMLIYAQKISIEVSFLVEKTLEKFILGAFKDKHIRIIDKHAHNEFLIDSIQKIEPTITSNTCVFRTLSPLVIAYHSHRGKKQIYLPPTDDRYSELFIENLMSKYKGYRDNIFANQIDHSGVKPVFEFLQYGKSRSKLITIKPHKEAIKVRGYLFDFRLTAPLDILEVGYHGGFGAKNSQGFGCCTLI